jgi:hypothetical protein
MRTSAYEFGGMRNGVSLGSRCESSAPGEEEMRVGVL